MEYNSSCPKAGSGYLLAPADHRRTMSKNVVQTPQLLCVVESWHGVQRTSAYEEEEEDSEARVKGGLLVSCYVELSSRAQNTGLVNVHGLPSVFCLLIVDTCHCRVSEQDVNGNVISLNLFDKCGNASEAAKIEQPELCLFETRFFFELYLTGSKG
jgi:hypothetical protein